MKRQLTAVSLMMMMGVACGEGEEQPSSPVSPGVPRLAAQALAELPVINEARVTREGCGYSMKVLQDVNPYPYPQPLYRITVQSEVVSPSTCTLVPRTVELGTSAQTPQIAIGANAEGVVVAYSHGGYVRPYTIVRIGIRRLDPNTLGILRAAGLAGHWVPANGGAGAPGALSLEALTLRPSSLEVRGTLTGNSITEDPSTVPWPYPIFQGSHFVARYPDFFGTTQPPILGTPDMPDDTACPGELQGPTLFLHGNNPMTLECGVDTWTDPGAEAWDVACTPLEVHRYNSGSDAYGTGPNTSAEGTYPVQYSAWNAAGTTASAIRSVQVVDRRPPTLQLQGPARMVHTCGSPWVDPGVSAVDACYGNVAPMVRKTGQVNGWAVGSYTVRYEVTDRGGNSASPVTRTVDVVNCPW